MKSTNDLASAASIREQVRQFLRERTLESIIDQLSRGELQLADVLEELYLCHSELKLQQETLRDSQIIAEQLVARFVQLYRSLPVPTLLISLDGALKEGNTAATETLALDCKRFTQLATPRDTPILEDALRQARTHGQAACTEVTLRSARYDTLIVDLKLFLLPGVDHNPPELICTLIDQTDRIAQRKALISTAQVVDASTTIAVRWEAKPGWPLVYASENVRHWGFPIHAFASGYIHLIDLVHPEDREEVEAVFTDAILKRRPHFTLTCRFIWADNSVHWVELETSTQKVDGVNGSCYQGLIRDVTEREQAQIALRRQLRFQELIADISGFFANSLREDLDRVLDEALDRIGHFFRVDRCYLHHCHPDDQAPAHTHNWWTETLRADKDRRRRVEGGQLDAWLDRIRQTGLICVPDAMRMAPEGDALQSELVRRVIRSRLILPLNSEGHLLGALGLDTLVKPRAWTEEEIRLLRLLSETIASMLVRQRIEHERQTSETRYRHLSATMSDVAYSCVREPEGTFAIDWITDSVEALTGHTRKEVLARHGWGAFVLLEDRETFEGQVLGLAPGETTCCELRLRHRDGSLRWVRATTECQADATASDTLRLYGGLVDITEQKTRETERQRLALLVEQSPSIVVVTDLSGIIEYVNARFCEVTGYLPDEVRGQNVQQFQADTAPSETWSALWSNIRRGQVWRGEFQNRTKSGETFWEHALVTPLRDEHGVISHVVKLGEDVSDKKALTERLTYLIHYDPLTGLPNRSLMRERVDRALARARRKGHGLALLSIDLDRLKLVNDTLGHSAGDLLLREVAQRLQGLLEKEDTLARLGGDNFVLLLGRLAQVADVVLLAEQIRSLVEQPILLGKDKARITSSIGISLYPEDAQSTEALMSHADAALHKAQSEGRRLYRFYTPALNEQLLEQFQLEQALRHGLDHDELLLYYQPRVDIRTGEILSLEALVRWNHPQWGLIEPSRFIPIAESTGLILELGPVVLRQACRQLKAWQTAGIPVVPVAVNLSAKELYQDALSSRIQAIMTDACVDPGQLEFEITESAAMHSVDEAIDILSALRGLGFALAIDDFGTGHASLSYLNRLPTQTIKIDRSFLLKIGGEAEGEAQGAAIVKAIIGLGLNLGLHIIAEGVETNSQRDFLIENGCNVAQGHLFSIPLPADKIEPLLMTGSVSPTLH
ncbi:EAL domain-containing protein [Thiocystis violacea]|uniref:EAL domain-containing protein n=1 Tax=Thiocystis violacea TaxID=13725 RepID=UPI00190729F1|nr:EAL domain-containing protein [Thiocystis violacea]MBK1721926.1 hypothetical protein [Thiocystis violacea]